MTEPTPPSIPPRQRPTEQSGEARQPTSSRAQTGSAVAWDSPEETRPVRTSVTGRTATSKNGRSPTGPASGPTGTASGPTGTAPGPNGTQQRPNGTASAGSSSKAPAATAVAENGHGATGATSVSPGSPPNSPAHPAREATATPQTRSDADFPAPTDDDEPPSPLQTAVDTATVWVRRAATATGAAIGSMTRPRTEEAPMTTIPPAPAPASAPSAATPPASAPRTAGTGPAGLGTAARPATGRIPAVGGPRRVRLAISRVDPWSVMKLSFLLSVAAGIMLVVAAAAVWFTLDGLHVFTKVNDFIIQVTGKESGVNILQYVAFKRVVSGATLIAVIDVFLLTALSTIGAFLYNIVAALVGGLHVTMTDE